MKNELLSLESEPLLYFLLHSSVFVAAVGGVFFFLGLVFGALTWGRYKKQSRTLRAEGTALREEIAGLKRKLAEQVVARPGTVPLQSPPPALLTEVLPKISEIFPERAVASAPASPAPLAPPASAPVPVSSPAPAEIPSLPVVPESAFLQAPEPPVKMAVTRPVFQKPAPALAGPSRSTPSPRPRRMEDDLTPFSFLIEDEPEPEEKPQPLFDPDESEHLSSVASSLSDIIAPEVTAKPREVSPPPSVIPEHDPSLGLVFKERPADVDDLTRLQGISPAIQNRLQELGIYRLQQIAAWNQTHVREFSRRLAFKDRIERERWVEQARRLMMGEMI